MPHTKIKICGIREPEHARVAIDAGADIFLPKPLASVSAFQSAVQQLLPDVSRPADYASPGKDTVDPDPIALQDDLSLAVSLLAE